MTALEKICGLGGEFIRIPVQRRACSRFSDGSERGGRTVMPIRQWYFLVELSRWRRGKHCTVLGGRVRCQLCNLGRNSYKRLCQCECYSSGRSCASWVTPTVWKGYPQKGIKRDKTEEDVPAALLTYSQTYWPTCHYIKFLDKITLRYLDNEKHFLHRP